MARSSPTPSQGRGQRWPVPLLLAAAATVVAATAAIATAEVPRPTPLKCANNLGEDASLSGPVPANLQPKAFDLLPLGSTVPDGWLLNQLVLQANSLSGWMAISTFPGAVDVNTSLWIGGDGKTGGGTTQWLPYWTNGNVPLVGLIKAANATGRLDKTLNLPKIVDDMMAYVLAHTNKSTGWIGPMLNEPGDFNGHGLWDPLNMLRSIINYAQDHAHLEEQIVKACVAHMTEESKLLVTDPVYKWAQTRWPTFVEIAHYIIDYYVPKYGGVAAVMPLGGAGTKAMLLNASVLFAKKGMNWKAYYHQVATGATWNTYVKTAGGFDYNSGFLGTGGDVAPNEKTTFAAAQTKCAALAACKAFTFNDPAPKPAGSVDVYYKSSTKVSPNPPAIKFPEGSVARWNTNDHGVNNAEGALRWPAATWRMTGLAADREEMDFALGMLDKYQGQVAALFCADEVFCGRAPHRGTETCAVVEAMASLEYDFEVLGDPLLMDRVERLAFNAMPAALTADMWAHVYVQNANSVFAGHTKPNPKDPARRHHHLDARHGHGAAAGCSSCGHALGDTPSGEDQGANYYGVSHFPCCITNFPQGWPKFAMHTILTSKANEVVVASLVPSKALLPAALGGGSVAVAGSYPFGDTATITVTATKPVVALIRIPGWATKAVVTVAAGAPQNAHNGTFFRAPCKAGTTTITVALNPEVQFEFGWGSIATNTTAPSNGVAVTRGALVFALHPEETTNVTQTFPQDLPARPHARDLQIGTTDVWNYAIDTNTPPVFVAKASKGWSTTMPFDTDNFPFAVQVKAKQFKSWGYWEGSMITADIPPSPVDCAGMYNGGPLCGDEVTLNLVPYGGTNIRIAVFPWMGKKN